MLKKLYVGRICPVLEYGSAAISTAAKQFNIEKKKKISFRTRLRE